MCKLRSFCSVRHVRACVVFKRQATRIDNILHNSLIVEHKNHKKRKRRKIFPFQTKHFVDCSYQYAVPEREYLHEVRREGKSIFLTVYTNRSVYTQEIVTCFVQNSKAWVEEIC